MLDQPPEDPTLPLALIEALERLWIRSGRSGDLVFGIGSPFLRWQLRSILEARFSLSGLALDHAEKAVADRISAEKARDQWEARRERRGPSWVNSWSEGLDRIRLF